MSFGRTVGSGGDAALLSDAETCHVKMCNKEGMCAGLETVLCFIWPVTL